MRRGRSRGGPSGGAGDPGSVARAGAAPSMRGAIGRLGTVLILLFVAICIGAAWWQVVEAERLVRDPLDPLRLVALGEAGRGRILAADGTVLADGGSAADPVRHYPYPAAAPATGYRSIVLGTAGLERTYDAELAGLSIPGDPGGLLRKLRTGAVVPQDLRLSLDVRLQRLAVQLLGDDAGAVVAIEPATGRVLVLASSPGYDPGALADPATAGATLDRLRDDPGAPLLDRATQGRYVPGSVFKLVTAAAALTSGAIDATTRFAGQPRWSRDGLVVDGYRISDAPRSVQLDEPLDLAEAMEVSSNVWFAHAALEAGPEAMAATAARLGIGRPVPFELPVAAGQLNGGDGPLAGFGDRVELAATGYGQGEVLVTPLEMAQVAAAIANGGELMAPRLVDRIVDPSGAAVEPVGRSLGRVLDDGVAGAIRDAMVRAVEGPFAAALAGGAAIPGVVTAGKSGSAELGVDERPHSWFVGFAPADQPRIAIVVVVEHGGYGAERAVPLAGRILRAWWRGRDVG